MEGPPRRGSSDYTRHNSISGASGGGDAAARRGSKAFLATNAIAGIPVSDEELAQAEPEPNASGREDEAGDDVDEDEDGMESDAESKDDVKSAIHPHYGITVRQLELSQGPVLSCERIEQRNHGAPRLALVFAIG